MLTGSQVEFLSFDKRVAKSIYITHENVNVSSILSADSIGSARAKALWGIGLLIFSFILYIGQNFNFIQDIGHIGQIIAIVGFVLYSMAIYSVRKAAASKSLFKNYIIAVIINFLGLFFVYMLAPILGIILLMPAMSGLGTMLLFGPMIALIVVICGYRIHAELARLSGSSLFLWAFWIYTVSVLLCFSVFGIFVGFAGFIIVWIITWMLLFVAWWGFKKLEKK
ncbi:hypothetical protein [Campylobacter sp.]|uniref:hypothetical protein n=1 Tax=Campylobacter sp. TaxID=205 RepID=UPI002A760696|nr:hypothetical protein [Campylobacter sp.]MDY2764391.1 hypothetical protein [Campylobacter sp.]